MVSVCKYQTEYDYFWDTDRSNEPPERTPQFTTLTVAVLSYKERAPCSLQYTVQKATIHQLTTMLATSKNVLFPGHNQRCWWLDTLIIAQAPACEGLSAPVVSRWLWPGNKTFLVVDSMVVSWWIVGLMPSVHCSIICSVTQQYPNLHSSVYIALRPITSSAIVQEGSNLNKDTVYHILNNTSCLCVPQ